jgi:small-conductance mechanosensitive channel/ABC-type amino acid transport substrate-binding protein
VNFFNPASSGQVDPMLKQKRFKVALLIGMVLLVTGGALLWTLVKRAHAPRTVRVGFYVAPPFQTINLRTGVHGGFYIDFLEEVARRKGLRLEYVDMPTFAQMLDCLRNGGDCLMTVPISVTDKRRESFDFSWPCGITSLKLAGRTGDINGKSPGSLADKWVGFMRGGIQTEICQRWIEEGKIAGIRLFKTNEEAAQSLLSGELDLILDEIEFIDVLRANHPDAIDVIDDSSFTAYTYEAFPVVKGQEWLVKRLNAGLREIMNDGEYSRIYRRHFPGEAPSGSTPPVSYAGPYAGEERLPRVEIDENYNAKAILDHYFDEISSRTADQYNERVMKIIDCGVSEACREFEDKLRRARVRLDELLLLLKSRPTHAPYVTFFYLGQMDDLKTSFADIRGALEAYARRFKNENAQAKSNLLMIQHLKIPQPELRWRKSWIETNLGPIIETQNRWIEKVDDMSRQSEAFLEELAGVMAETEYHILDDYQDYKDYRFDFFGNHRGTGKSYQWLELSRILETWLMTLPTQFRVIFPNHVWWPGLLQLLLLILVAGVALSGLALRFGWFDLKRFLLPCVFTWFGLYFTMGILMIPSISYDFFLSLAMLFLSLAIMGAAWRMRTAGWDHRGINPFFFFVVSFFLIDLMTGLLAPFKVLMGVLAALSLINLLWLMWCAYSKRRRHKRDTTTALLVGGLLWAGAGTAAWTGYLYLAMGIAIFGGMTLCVIFAGTVFTRFLASTAGNMAKSHRSLASFLSTLVIPFLWIILIFGAVHWSANVFNAKQFFIQFYSADLAPSFPIRISLKLLLTLFLLGLFVKFTLNWLSNMLSAFTESRKDDSGALQSTFLIVQYLVWSIYILYTLASLGVDWNNLKWIVGGLSVGFGFALKDILENFFCGLIILIGKQVRPGDIVEFGEVLGTVIKINVRATFIKTYDNAIIIIPNNQIVGKELRNWTLNGHIRRIQIDVGVAYDSDIPLVMETLLEAMKSSKWIIMAKAPEVLFLNFGDSALIFRARFWIHTDNWVKAPSALRVAILEMFRERGIAIAFPQLDVHVDPPDAKALREPEAVPSGAPL